MLFCGGIETTLTWNVTIIVLFGRIISRLIPVIGFSLGLGTPSTRMLFGTNVVPEAIASSRSICNRYGTGVCNCDCICDDLTDTCNGSVSGFNCTNICRSHFSIYCI